MRDRTTDSALRTTVFVALFAAALAVISPWAIPIGTIPVTFSLVGIYIIGGVLGSLRGSAVVLVYLAIGLVGAPVFAGFGGGIGHFSAPTGGFLIGYLPCVLIVGISKKTRENRLLPVVMVLGTLAMYTIGGAWLCVVSALSMRTVVLTVLLPCLAVDALKIALATVLIPLLRAPLSRVGV